MSTNKNALEQRDLQAVEQLKKAAATIKAELGKVIVGQDQVVEEVLIAIFTRSHALLVGVPGLAKTLLVSRTIWPTGLSRKFLRPSKLAMNKSFWFTGLTASHLQSGDQPRPRVESNWSRAQTGTARAHHQHVVFVDRILGHG